MKVRDLLKEQDTKYYAIYFDDGSEEYPEPRYGKFGTREVAERYAASQGIDLADGKHFIEIYPLPIHYGRKREQK